MGGAGSVLPSGAKQLQETLRRTDLTPEQEKWTLERLLESYHNRIRQMPGTRWRKALSFFDEMREQSLQPQGVHYDSMIAVAAQARGKQPWTVSLQLLQDMEESTGAVSAAAVDGVCDQLLGANQVNITIDLMEELKRKPMHLHRAAFISALKCCSRVGYWEHALAFLQDIAERKLDARADAWSEAHHAARVAGEDDIAEELADDLEEHGFSIRMPDDACIDFWFREPEDKDDDREGP